MSPFALITTEEVQPVHESNTSCTRSLLRLLTHSLYLHPAILADTVLVDVVKTLIIVSTGKQVNVSVRKDALMTCAWCENLPLRMYFDPLIDLHLLEVLFGVLVLLLLDF